MKFFLLFFSLTAAMVFAQDITIPTGKMHSMRSSDFYSHPATTEKFNETWSYQFVLNNETKAFVDFSSLYIPTKGRKVGCNLSFWNFKGKNYSVGRQYPIERLKENQTLQQITIKKDYFLKGLPGIGHQIHFAANKGGAFYLDLKFESALRGKIPGNGIWKVGDAQYGQYVLIPYGRVQGKIAYNGDTLSVSGYGYMDHTWQTTQATDLVARTFFFSTNSNSFVRAGRMNITPQGNIFGYAIASDNGKFRLLTPEKSFENDKVYSGAKFPKGDLTLRWNEKEEPLRFNVSRVQQKFSLLDNFDGWMAKKAAKFMMGGEVFFYRGRSSLEGGQKIDWSFTGL